VQILETLSWRRPVLSVIGCDEPLL